jgi:hypothetical protein
VKFKKMLGILLLAGGIIVLVLALLADAIGIGSGGFGIRQIAGVVAGGIAAIVGLVLMLKKK